MPREEYLDRTVQIYFGTEEDNRLTKAEVGEFIRTTMGLERADDAPHWSAGILELAECGMDYYEQAIQPTDPELVRELEDAKTELQELQKENQILKQQIELQESSGGRQVRDPAKQTHETECRILEVLCRDEHIGHDDPNYVDTLAIARETGLDAETVHYHLHVLAQPHLGLVQEDRNEDRVKATHSGVFEEHCKACSFDPTHIRGLNA